MDNWNICLERRLSFASTMAEDSHLYARKVNLFWSSIVALIITFLDLSALQNYTFLQPRCNAWLWSWVHYMNKLKMFSNEIGVWTLKQSHPRISEYYIANGELNCSDAFYWHISEQASGQRRERFLAPQLGASQRLMKTLSLEASVPAHFQEFPGRFSGYHMCQWIDLDDDECLDIRPCLFLSQLLSPLKKVDWREGESFLRHREASEGIKSAISEFIFGVIRNTELTDLTEKLGDIRGENHQSSTMELGHFWLSWATAIRWRQV
jgi:hypothetical protein